MVNVQLKKVSNPCFTSPEQSLVKPIRPYETILQYMYVNLFDEKTYLTAAIDDFPEEWHDNDINEGDDSYHKNSKSPGLKLILVEYLQSKASEFKHWKN